MLVLLMLPVLPGCCHYRVVALDPDPATDYERRTVHAFLWGLLQQDVEAADRVSGALDIARRPNASQTDRACPMEPTTPPTPAIARIVAIEAATLETAGRICG